MEKLQRILVQFIPASSLTKKFRYMLSNKLITLLKTFSKHDLNSLKKYLDSPFFNESAEIQELYSLIYSQLKTIHKKEEWTLSKQEAWKNIFPNEAYNDLKMRRLSSDLIKHAFAFLAYKNYKSDPLREQTFLLEALNNPSRAKHFNSVVKQTKSIQEKSDLKHFDYHFYKYLINRSQCIFNEKSRKSFSKELEKADFHIDCYYFLNKLENYCDVLSYRSFLPMKSEVKIIPDFFAYLEKENFLKVPAIKAYYLVSKMLLHPEEESFFHELKVFLQHEEARFHKEELSAFYTHLINYCIHEKINIGKTEFFVELFNLYKLTLEKFPLVEREKFDVHRYKNIITVGLHVKEYEWVENFIQKYTNSLPKEHRENAHTYNFAKVYFSQKKYTKVIEQLREVKYKNHIYALGGKLILLKTYYELQEYQALDSLIDSFRIYVRRNRLISREVKQQYLNLLRFVKKLSGIIAGDKKALEKVSLQIDKCKALAGKKWILEKVEELA